MNKKYTNLKDIKNHFYDKFPKSDIKFLKLLNNRYVIVKDKYGVYKYYIDTILYYGVTSIKCAINKTEMFINKAKEIHSNKYDYSYTIYTGALKKLVIVCPTHGKFEQTANSHIQKFGCPECGKLKRNRSSTKSVDYYLKKLKIINSNYTIKKEDYINLKTPIKHFCKTQKKWFKMRPSHVLSGQVCRKCANKKISENAQKNSIGWSYTKWEEKGLKSKNFDSFKFYIIKCWNNKETFYKIGKTFRKIEDRFQSKTEMPYKWKIIKIIKNDALIISKIEEKMKKSNKKNKHKPLVNFSGKYECYKKLKS